MLILIDMNRDKLHVCNVRRVLSALISVILILSLSSCQVECAADAELDDDTNFDDSNPAATQLFAQLIYNRISNFTKIFHPDIKKHFGFCIENVDEDWNGAFNFTDNLGFLTACGKKTNGDLAKRICTAAEIKFFFNSYFSNIKSMKSSSYIKPNINCNLTSWVPGCEPGWACSADKNQKIDLKNSKDMPARTEKCTPCCEGFFCPHGLTCMIPCPKGSYCPMAKLNKTTGICEPYTYQLPPGQTNHTCGGADVWADIESSSDVFCSAGYYCPSTVQKIVCPSGHYCRTGSTSSTRCLDFAQCDPKSSNQNIYYYGVMLFGAISVLLVIIYNCSDQVLATREKRQAKSREKAVKSVRETQQAREKWKSARDIAKKHALGLQTQLSRTFSKRKSTRQSDLRGLSQKSSGEVGLPPLGMSESSSASKGKKKEKNNLTKMLQSIENDPESSEGFNLEIGDKNLKKNMPKGKQLHTHSQIFKYAYNQIEKEKALQEQNKNLTFSGVISMATDIEIRKRPTIEVAFKDLTLTLKGKKKHLLRCVTGKISPGRVSAVMGPSGAGKTTFLSALAGKATGCTMSGTILINGKVESIHSYKKIIGFVPQDDIVHGNLTVEENLWFSARCRLPADLPKPEKVLVVERVIESLGLQAVRDSLVGTVAKRGISGGQRKRVNVGLEMVMEPSLLILDEPTSGLDSASSLLLLRALRREALEGVNVIFVVHQPSYTLFRMFDELILLAKGGLTVYHGSVKKIEEYFNGLGITVPERVNPPDHYIDILEGIVKINTNNGVTYKQLPVRWMLHNGYPVPPDMLKLVDGISTTGDNSAHGGNNPEGGGEEQSFAGDLWEDVKTNVELKKDSIQHNFLKTRDLSDRITPGVLKQYKYFLGRVSDEIGIGRSVILDPLNITSPEVSYFEFYLLISDYNNYKQYQDVKLDVDPKPSPAITVGKQRLREARIQAVDYLILLLAGVCLGTLAKVSDETFGALGYTYTVIAVSLLCKIGALRSFTLDKLEYWRESASGMSSLAYFMAKDTVDHFNTLIKPLVYLSMFYFFNNPRSTFADNYVVLLCLVYCVTGMAYVFAILFEPGPAQLWSVLLPVVLTLIATRESDGSIFDEISNVCYPKWALEAFVIANAKRYGGVWLITRCGSLMKNGYDIKNWSICLILLAITGLASRIIAFLCMVVVQKK